ncbi:MAG: TonB-dependent receptor domain-containing protein [Gemmatimonadota bacterium]
MRRHVSLIAAALGLGLVASAGHAQQSGRIAGRVIDDETARPVPLAQVSIPALSTGTLSDVEGRFSLPGIPAGVHEVRVRLLGYAGKTITGVEVRAGEVTVVDVSLPPEAVAVEELTVSVAEERGTTSALLETRKQAAAVTDAIGQEQISRSPDSDAAAAMARVPGVSIVDRKFVYVRGLGERYSNTTLDGAIVPSPIPDRKAVPLDLIPASFIESVSTSKSYLPDQPADYAGGLVQIETRKVPGRNVFRLGISTGFDTEASLVEGLDYAGGGLDFLGFDDGARDLPDILRRDVPLTASNFSPDELESIGEAFGSTWAGTPAEHPLNKGGELALSTDIPIGSRELGIFATASWSDVWNRREGYVERVFAASGLADPEVDYDGRLSSHDVNLGALVNGEISVSPTSRLSFSGLFNRVTADQARVLEGFNLDSNTEQRNTRIQYVENTLLQGWLSGKHYLGFLLGGSTLEWRGAYARAARYEPNTREVLYRRASDGRFLFDDFIQSGSVFHQDLAEDAYNGGLDLRIPIRVNGVPGAISLGAVAAYRDRDVYTRRFRFRPQGGIGDEVRALDPNDLLTPAHIAPDSFQIQEATFRADNYVADQTILAGYVMADVEILPRLRIAGGVRVETTDQDVQPIDRFDATLEPLPGADLDDTDLVPGANLTWSPNDAMNVRVAASRTLARPEFREQAPFSFADYAGGYLVAGNPLLERSRITNLDLRWEWFPHAGAVVSLGGFYKFFDDPIEELVFPSSEFIKTWVNVDEARNFGAEIEARSDLGFLGDGLENLGVNLNLTLVDSEVNTGEQALIFIPGTGPFTIQVVDKDRRLQGQSPYVVNAGLNWAIPSGTTLTLLYNRFGRRVSSVGTEFLADVFEEPRDAFDVVVDQRISDRLGLKASGVNVLGGEYRFTHGGDLLRGWEPGRTFSLKLSWQPVGLER